MGKRISVRHSARFVANFLRLRMRGVYRPLLWEFSGNGVRASFRSAALPSNTDFLVVCSQDGSSQKDLNHLGAQIGDYFSSTLSEELRSRAMVAARIAMHSVTSAPKLREGINRTRVELDLILDIPGANPNDLIDLLTRVKERCCVFAGDGVKILLKAELKTVSTLRK